MNGVIMSVPEKIQVHYTNNFLPPSLVTKTQHRSLSCDWALCCACWGEPPPCIPERVMQRGDTVREESSGYVCVFVYLHITCVSAAGACVWFLLLLFVSSGDFISSSSTLSCVRLQCTTVFAHPVMCLCVCVCVCSVMYCVLLPTSTTPLPFPVPRPTSAPWRCIGVREYGERNTGRPHSTTWKEF